MTQRNDLPEDGFQAEAIHAALVRLTRENRGYKLLIDALIDTHPAPQLLSEAIGMQFNEFAASSTQEEMSEDDIYAVEDIANRVRDICHTRARASELTAAGDDKRSSNSNTARRSNKHSAK